MTQIEERANLHLSCDAASVCDSSYYIGGFHGIDLIAWAMETKRAIYMIWTDKCSVDVFEPFKYPYNINLEDASPSKEDTVMELRNEHFNSLVPLSNLCDVESCLSKRRGTSGKCTKHGGGSRCEVAGCDKMALRKSTRCGEHGGGLRCEVADCN